MQHYSRYSAMRKKATILTTFLFLLIFFANSNAQDRTMMQGFYWDVSPGGVWYDSLAYYSEELGKAGFDGIWMPPPSKGFAGGFDVGYTPYDYYDLGEFSSQGSVATRYGTRAQLVNAIQALQGAGLEVYMDLVLNHRSGGSLEYNPYYNPFRGADDASNYTGWGGGNTQGGSGFSEWTFSTSGDGSAGFFRGTSNREGREPIDTDGNAFGMFSNDGTGTGAFASRAFAHNSDGELKPGESFSFDFSFRFTDGRRGIDLWENSNGTGFLANIEHAGSDALTFFPGAVTPSNRETIVGNIFNKATRLTFIWNGGSSNNLTIRAESLADNSFSEERTITVSAPPKSFTLLFENTISGGDYEPFFNNFNISNTYAADIPKGGSTFFEFCVDVSSQVDCSQFPEGDDARLSYTAFPLANGSGRIAWDPFDINDPENSRGGVEFFYPNAAINPGNTGDFFADNQLFDGTFGGFHQMYINGFGYDNALHDGFGNSLPKGDSLKVWGDWLTNELGLDGYRFDFVKGIHPEYFKSFMSYGAMAGKFQVHELYDGDMTRKRTYLSMLNTAVNPFSTSEPAPSTAAIFDFNLRFTYKDMTEGGDSYDIRALHTAGLFNNDVPYEQIVTFVENHDFDRLDYQGNNTFTDGSHQPIVENKMLAYAHMLTHPGYAQVWWRDYFYYGLGDEIRRLVAIRNQFASGPHRMLTTSIGDPFWPGGNQAVDEQQVYVMQREGIDSETGLIMAMNKHSSFDINVWVSVVNKPEWCGKELIDLTGTITNTIQIQEDCRVQIQTKANSYSVFVPVDYTFDVATGVLTGQEGWRLLSAPVETTFDSFLAPIWTQGATAASIPGGTPNIYRWNNDVGGKDVEDWLPVTDLTQTIEAGTGFLAYVYDQDVFDDPATAGFPKYLPARGNEIEAPVSPIINSTTDGWTLLGNPFALTIDWDRVEHSGIHDVVYVWDVNDSGGLPSDPDLGAVGTWKVSASGLGEFDGRVRPFQGFFVQTSGSSPTVTFTNASKKPGGAYFGKEQQPDFVKLTVEGNGMSNNTWLRFSNLGGNKQTSSDALQLMPLSENYTIFSAQKEDGNLYHVGHFPPPDENLYIPLFVEGTRSGSYTIVADIANLPSHYTLYFVDYETDFTTQIDRNFQYEFELNQTAKSVNDPFKSILAKPQIAKSTENHRFAITARPLNGTDNTLPTQITLSQNYPNPFNPSTVISFELPESNTVTLEVFDMVGRQVATLVSGSLQAGTHQVTFDAAGLSSGVYLYRLTAGSTVLSRRLTVLK
ncbi:MAG: T9SS C-terminal target domain-containing protein [Balneolaceae bacterium]|nr:MAG: T9SS C-terminal target domain-containing protein [Balneolaceae bacterium]